MRVSREFKQNFDVVAKWFDLAALGELEEAKECVRRDPEGAATCYAAMGAWVREQSVCPQVRTSLASITREQIDAQTSKLNQARQRGIVRDVRSSGRNDSVGALEFRRAREGKVTESA